MKCNECEGKGYYPKRNFKCKTDLRRRCLKCLGKGDLDWLEVIIGVDRNTILYPNHYYIDILYEKYNCNLEKEKT